MCQIRGLKVLQVGKYYAPYRGGIETHLQTLSEELSEVVDVRVLVANTARTTRTEFVQGVDVTRFNTWCRVAGAPFCPSMAGAIRRSGADIVHMHLPNPTAVLAYLASGCTGKLVVTYHSDIVRQKFLAKLFNPVLKQALDRSSALVSTSLALIEKSPVLAAYRHRCSVVPLGIRLDPFERYLESDVEAIRQKYGPRIVMAVGRLVYYKGFEYLIQAMGDVDGHLLLIGKGPLRESLERQVETLNLGRRVSILGEIDDLVPYYHASDVFVLPSIECSEAFGIVQLEAMACRKPIINTQLNSGVPYISPHGVTGLTVPPADADTLAAAITTLLDDDALRTQYGNAGRRRVEEEFSSEVLTQRMMEVYERVANSTEPKSEELVLSA